MDMGGYMESFDSIRGRNIDLEEEGLDYIIYGVNDVLVFLFCCLVWG